MGSQAQDKRQFLRSCEACRTSKIRCMLSDVPDSRCQRCDRLNKSCTFSEAKTRARKHASSAGRVLELEKKIDRLSSLLQQPSGSTDASDASRNATEPSSTEPQPFGTVLNADGNISRIGPQLTPSDSQSGYSDRFTTYRNETPQQSGDIISKGWLTVTQVEQLLDLYRLDFGNFPFVVVPSMALEQLRYEQPNVLLAMLIAAARKDFALQQALEAEFKNKLCTHIIIEGTRNIEQLRALLIFVAWYYHRFKLIDNQWYMLIQIAVTIALELELERPRTTDEETEDEDVNERKRTLLGIYYFSSGISRILRKPVALRYSITLEEYARSLAVAKRAPLDPYIIHFVQLQGLAEEIASAFGYNDVGQAPLSMNDIESVESRVNIFNLRLQRMKLAIPKGTPLSSVLFLTTSSIAVYLFEVGLHFPAVSSGTSVADENTSFRPQAISALSNILWACLDAIKTIQRSFMNVTNAEMISQTLMDKSQLAHAAIVNIKIAFARIPGLEGFPLRQAADAGLYFQQMGERVGELSFTQPYAEHQDSFLQFKNTTQVIKMWYESLLATSGSLDELQGMNPLQLMDIVRKKSGLDIDWKSLDVFFAEGNVWNNLWI